MTVKKVEVRKRETSMMMRLLLVAVAIFYPVNGNLTMKEEDTLNIDYSPTSSLGQILSPGYSEDFNNTEGNTKIVISYLPNKFWLNLVYQPATPSSTDVCDEFPFLIYNGDSTSPIAAKVGCGNVHFNKVVPTKRNWRTIDAIITGIQQITIAVKQSDSLYGAFQLYYSIEESIYSLSPNSSGGALVIITERNPSGFIASHDTFNFATKFNYPKDTNNLLKLSVPTQTTKIEIEYIFFNIGTVKGDCALEENKGNGNLDQFSIVNGHIGLYGCGGGGSIPSTTTFDIKSHEDTIQFTLKEQSEDEKFAGFLIKYKLHICSDIPYATITRNGDSNTGFSIACFNGETKVASCNNSIWSTDRPNCSAPSQTTETQQSTQLGTVTGSTKYGSTNQGLMTLYTETRTGKSTGNMLSGNTLYLIIGSAGGGALLLIVIIVLLSILVSRRNQRKSDHENTEQSVHQSESSPIPMSSLPMENERKHINANAENNYAGVDMEVITSRPNIAIVSPNNSAAVYDSPRIPRQKVTVDDQPEADTLYSNRETINRQAQENDITNVYSDIRSETKKKRPSQAAASGVSIVPMEDNELYGTGEP